MGLEMNEEQAKDMDISSFRGRVCVRLAEAIMESEKNISVDETKEEIFSDILNSLLRCSDLELLERLEQLLGLPEY